MSLRNILIQSIISIFDCVPYKVTWYRRYQIILEGASPLQASWESVSSRKTSTLAYSNVSEERSDAIKAARLQNPVLTNRNGI